MSKKIFLYNEFRSHKVQMDVEEAIEKHAPWFMKEYKQFGELPDTLLYRGKKGNFDEDAREYKTQSKIQLTDPTKSERTFHSPVWQNLIIDNTEAWTEYPKRQLSLICSTSESFAQKYGTTYVVIPVEKNVKIGVVPGDDIWFGFDEFLGVYNHVFQTDFGDLSEFEEFSSDMIGVDYWQPPLSFESFKERTQNNKFYDNLATQEMKERYKKFVMREHGNFFSFLMKYMTPEYNGFKALEYNFDTHIPHDFEVWIGSKCLLIETDLFNSTFGH
jgi:hypothetical protein